MTPDLEERMRLLPGASARWIVREASWLTGELVATDQARARLRAWALAGRPAADPDALPYIGDLSMRATVRGVLRKLPAPVVHHVVTRCLILAVGADALGWTSPAPQRPASQLILLCSLPELEDLADLAAHEIAHAWLEPGRSELGTKPSMGDAGVDVAALAVRAAALAVEWGLEGSLANLSARPEIQAACLTRSWGFNGRGADPRYASTWARTRVLAACAQAKN